MSIKTYVLKLRSFSYAINQTLTIIFVRNKLTIRPNVLRETLTGRVISARRDSEINCRGFIFRQTTTKAHYFETIMFWRLGGFE